MSRLIDADAVEKVLEEKHFRRVLDSDRWLIADIRKSIMDLPTIDAEPHWIPCSERLPEDTDDVLVTYYSDVAKMGNEESPVFRRIYETYVNGLPSMDGKTYRRLMMVPEITMLWYYPEEKQWSFLDGSDLPEYITITAWMPLPKPYEVKE